MALWYSQRRQLFFCPDRSQEALEPGEVVHGLTPAEIDALPWHEAESFKRAKKAAVAADGERAPQLILARWRDRIRFLQVGRDVLLTPPPAAGSPTARGGPWTA